MAEPFHKLYVKIDGVVRFFDEKDDEVPIRTETFFRMYTVNYDGKPKTREEIIKVIKSNIKVG